MNFIDGKLQPKRNTVEADIVKDQFFPRLRDLYELHEDAPIKKITPIFLEGFDDLRNGSITHVTYRDHHRLRMYVVPTSDVRYWLDAYAY